jgi:hypothetical protein
MAGTTLSADTARDIIAEVSANGEKISYRNGYASGGDFASTVWHGEYMGGSCCESHESYTYEVRKYVCEAYSSVALYVWSEDEGHADGGAWEILFEDGDQH